MKTDTYIVPYARTLLEVAIERDQLEEIREEADALIKLRGAEPRMLLFLESPRVERGDKLKVISAFLEGKVTDTLYKFILLVVRNGRAEGLIDIFERFREFYDDHVGLVAATVTTATELPEELRQKLEETLAKRLEKTIELETRVDEDLLGGMVVRFSGMVADSSLRTALNSMGADMLSQKLGSELVHEN